MSSSDGTSPFDIETAVLAQAPVTKEVLRELPFTAKLGIATPANDPFSDDLWLHDIRGNDNDWYLAKPLTYTSGDYVMTVAGGNTDLASVPPPFTWLIPSHGRYSKAAVLHDHLWRLNALAPKRTKEERRIRARAKFDADARFRIAMHELDVPWLRRWFMWAAVEWAAIFSRVPLLGLSLLVITAGLTGLAATAAAPALTWVTDRLPLDVPPSFSVPIGVVMWSTIAIAAGATLLVALGGHFGWVLARFGLVGVLTVAGLPFLLLGLPVYAAIFVFFLIEEGAYQGARGLRWIWRRGGGPGWSRPVPAPALPWPFTGRRGGATPANGA